MGPREDTLVGRGRAGGERGRAIAGALAACTVCATCATCATCEAADLADAAQGASAPASTPARDVAVATVEQPRPFGHVVGDMLRQRVLLQAAGRALTPSALAPAARVGVWWDRRAARVERDPAGRDWMVVDWQLVNAPAARADVRLPAWRVPTREPPGALQVPALDVGVNALTTPAAPEAEGWTLRGDHGPALPDLPAMQRRLAFSTSAAALCALAWLAWRLWRDRRDAATRPFARAWHALDALDDGERDGPGAHALLHRAFDDAAGEVVRADTVHRLLARAPALAGERDTIERFLAQSSARFFGTPAPERPVGLHAWARTLRRIERAGTP